ncbi:MAG: hypothetical protein J7M14_00705, partial [Planctomycetes bacterium]|nr:hypothetical protein [Planctomycetota bacterium]
MDKRKAAFWAILIGMDAAIITLALWWVLSTFSITITRKDAESDYTRSEKSAVTMGLSGKIDFGEFMPLMTEGLDTQDVPDEKIFDLRRIHPYCGFKASPAVRG